jgi:hypothetical protein
LGQALWILSNPTHERVGFLFAQAFELIEQLELFDLLFRVFRDLAALATNLRLVDLRF